MLPLSDTLFYIVFTAQILVISYYFPRKIIARMQYVSDHYPPDQYPKLYPRSPEYYRIGKWAYKTANNLILILGFVIMLALIFVVDHATFADDGYISEAWPAFYGMIQFIPLMTLELFEFSQFKLMREANDNKTRKAVLRPRRLFDYVSPYLVASALALLVCAIAADLYVARDNLTMTTDAVQRSLIVVGGNLFMGALASWILYGRNLNPHQSFHDRNRQISTTLHSFVYVSMAMSVFFVTQTIDDVYPLNFLDATLLSLYFQAVVLLSVGHSLKTLRIEGINFDVYKANGATAA